jgi:hypothetical protein
MVRFYHYFCVATYILSFQAEKRQRDASEETQGEVTMFRKQIKDLNLKISEVDTVTRKLKEKEVRKSNPDFHWQARELLLKGMTRYS